MSSSVLYQITEVDPTSPLTKGKVYQVHKVTAEEAPFIGGKTYNAIMIKDPDDPLVSGKVYQVTFIADPTDPTVKGKVYNAIVEGGGEIIIIGPATPPLELSDAIADSLTYVKAYGGTEQTNVPVGYTQVGGITNGVDENEVTGYINTGVVADVDDIEYDVVATVNTPAYVSWYLLQSRDTTSNPIFGISGSLTGNTFIGAVSGTNITIPGTSLVRQEGHTYHVNFKFKDGTGTIFVEDLTGGTTETNTATYTYSAPANPIGVFSNLSAANNTMVAGNTTLMSAYVKKSGVKVLDYVPCVDSNNTPGFYDRVSGAFKTAAVGTLVAVGTAIPSPSAPMDIVCNNGVLKARHKSGLPLGYTQVEYLESFGAQYIDTGRVPNNTDIIEQKFQVKQLSNTTIAWYGSMPSSSAILPRIGMGTYILNGVTKFFVGVNATNDVFPSPADTDPHTVWWHVVGSHTLEFSTDGSEPRTVGYPTGNFYEPAVELTSYLFARHGTDGVQVYDGAGTKIYYHKEYLANGTLVLDLVPVRRNSDNELGMYDFVSGQFFTNQGSGDFVAGNPVSDPVEIYADGLVETIKDSLNNTATCENLLSIGDYTDVQEILSGDITRKVGVRVLDGTENWTTSSGANYTRFSTTDVIAATGGAESAGYCTHYPIIYGNVVGQMYFGSINQALQIIETLGTTMEQFKQWLADQYAAGTPVIIVYPLATETTESVAGQTLQVTDGDNTLEITQASLSGLELEAEYTKEG